MNARNGDKGIGSGENGTWISGLLVTDKRCGLSTFCLTSWTFLSVVVLINNICWFHQVLPLRDRHILSPIKSVLPITIANEMTLLNILHIIPHHHQRHKSLMPHGNQNTHFQMTVTHWHATNFNITFDPRPFTHYAFFWPTSQRELGIRSLLGNAAWNPPPW